jgi:hypothetical protein
MTAFWNWIQLTADMTQLLLAFVIRLDRLTWHHGVPDHPFSGTTFFSKALVLDEIRPLQVHFQWLLGVDDTSVDPLGTTIGIHSRMNRLR